MAGKLIKLCVAEVIFGLPRSVWPERGKNQLGRLLCSKLEQKLDMEEVDYMTVLLVGSECAEFWRNCSESDKSMKLGPDIVHMVLIKIRSGGTPKIDFLTSY